MLLATQIIVINKSNICDSGMFGLLSITSHATFIASRYTKLRCFSNTGIMDLADVIGGGGDVLEWPRADGRLFAMDRGWEWERRRRELTE